ncbi:MAG: GntR family transcriptional regulator [Roseobacter sp.]
MQQKLSKVPEHQAVYLRLRERILLGKYAPGEPVTIHGLCADLGVGMTPAREAIRRLSAENALETLGNRRVVVPNLSIQHIEDLYFLRFQIEPELAARAAKVIEKQSIETLRLIDLEIDDAISRGDVDRYLERNNAFHTAIYQRADAPILERAVKSLWVQFGPSVRVVCGRYGTSSLPDKHSDLLDALSANDPEKAAIALRDDLKQGLDLIKLSCPKF